MSAQLDVDLSWETSELLRTTKDEAAVLLIDRNGKRRIRLLVDSANAASLEFLDESGAVITTLPSASP
jgi:hypothetical protein